MSRGPRAAAPVGFLLLLALVLNNRGCDGAAPAETVEEGGGSEAPDYGAALSNSLLYFEAQRSGRLPHNQLVLWRGHSGLTDGLQQGVELVGGYYDAGDHVKFGLPMAFTVTMLAWGAVDFAADVQAAGEWGHTLQAIKWGTDYFVKAHTEPFVSWAEVGDGDTDHYCWQRPEDMTTPRQAYRVDKDNPGSDLAGETAAALAAAALVFRRSNPHYSHLLHHAQQLFEFGDRYRGTYDSSIAEARSFYASVSGYHDELLWAALWLHRATGREDYLRYALDNNADGGWAITEFSWDVKYAGVQVLAGKVSRAIVEEKRIIFTGHSSGGSIATLAAIWFREKYTRQGSVNQAHSFCVTFGTPLIGDNIFNHAVRREGWSQCIFHFIRPLDIVPRIPLTPLASFREEIQAVLDWLSPQTPSHSPVGRSLAIPEYYETLLRSTLSIASYEACSFMGCTSSILATLTSFIEISPYKPCGTYLFLTSSEQLFVFTNSEAVLQLFFYCLQLDPQQQLLDAAARSLTAHHQYEPLKECMQNVACVDYLGTISSSALPGRQSNRTTMGSVELSKEAILHLSAAEQWEKQRQRNQTKIIDDNCKKIQEALRSLIEYKRTCELHGVSYYDSFKFQ